MPGLANQEHLSENRFACLKCVLFASQPPQCVRTFLLCTHHACLSFRPLPLCARAFCPAVRSAPSASHSAPVHKRDSCEDRNSGNEYRSPPCKQGPMGIGRHCAPAVCLATPRGCKGKQEDDRNVQSNQWTAGLLQQLQPHGHL
eukprot:1141087-Pelagomonas_calceolata.AAC.9